jgi:hypothetical protein
MLSAYFPATQTLHAISPTLENVPAGHAVQPAPVPICHMPRIHVDVVLPEGTYPDPQEKTHEFPDAVSSQEEELLSIWSISGSRLHGLGTHLLVLIQAKVLLAVKVLLASMQIAPI